MAFGKKKSSSGGKSDFKGKKGNFKKIGALLESDKYEKTYFNSDGYFGALVFIAKPDDGQEAKMYRVKNANFASREDLEEKGLKGLPKFLVGNLSINLDNAEEIDLSKIEDLSDIFEDSED